jgi:hypothetical protein
MELIKNALFFWLLVFFVTPLTAETETSSELELKKHIVGTWHSEYEWTDSNNPDDWIKARGEDIYAGDGTLEGAIDYTFPDKQDHFEYKATWDIKDDMLIIEITEIIGNSYLQIGTVTRDKILGLTDTTLELQAEDGNTMTLYR